MSATPALLLASLLAAPVPARTDPDPDAPIPAATAALLDLRAVQKELKLSAEQRVAIIDRLADIREAHEKEIDRLWRDNPNPENRAAVAAVHRRDVRAEAARREFAAKLLTPPQRDRLRQVGWQVAGPEAFRDPAVVRALKLTADQEKALEAALGPYRTTAERFRNGAIDGDPSKASDELLKDRADAARDADRVLTPDQRAAWRAMAGEPAKLVDVTAVFLEAAGGGR